MRRKILIFFTVIIPFLATAQHRFPDYLSVVKKFYSSYHFEETEESRLGFAKKKNGWYVQLIDRYTGRDSTEQLFWSSQKGRYQVLENFVGANTEPLELKVNYFINQPNWYNAVHFSRCVYYGYDEWDGDVIKDYGSADIKNDTLLESLARAYSSYASRFFWYQYGGDSAVSDPLLKKLGRLEMPGDNKVNKARDYIAKAVALYTRINTNNRLYETTIGNIALKVFTENMHGFLQMTIAERPTEAKGFFDKCRLPVNDSVAAMNLLGSVETNGILFSYGDVETYTTMYLQKKHGVRKDIAIVDMNLLQLPAYLQYLKKNNIVSFVTTPMEYGKPQIDVLFFQSNPQAKRIRSIVDFIASYNLFKKVPGTGIDSVKVYDTERLFILSTSSDSIAFALPPYLGLDQFMILDIVSANFHSRPVHFTSAVPEYFLAYRGSNGLTTKLVAIEESYDDRVINIFNYLLNSYKPPFINFSNYSAEYMAQVSLHTSLYIEVIQHAVAHRQTAKADSLIKAWIAPFGERLPYLHGFENYAGTLYENKYESLADKLAEAYIKFTLRWSNDQNHYLFYNKQFAVSNLEKIKAVLQNYNRGQKAVDDAISTLSAQ